MPRALNRLRAGIHYRREAFDDGLRAAGFKVVSNLPKPEKGDILCIWNRYGRFAAEAKEFERRGATVLVAENGYLGKGWLGGEWFSLTAGHHGGAGRWPDGGPERWDSWGVELAPWRTGGTETVIFGQRGIGEPGVRSPGGWADATRHKYGGRIRPHPGTRPCVPLASDLKNARQALTWNSGAAVLALLMGIPVWCDYPKWIGAEAAKPLAKWPGEPKRDDEARLSVFRRMAWAQWTLDEIRTGEPIRRLL